MTPEQYHDATKHQFHRLAPSLGYLDWASQPAPFRSFVGAPVFPLYPGPESAAGGAGNYVPHSAAYGRLYAVPSDDIVPLSAAAIGDVLRHGLGLSAWKQRGRSRWPLRVNPSSGNLHPTEAYVAAGPMPGLGPTAAVYHYAADRHALEERSAFDSDAWRSACVDPARIWLIALTSIHWREAWKYGERAFRYCQHDLGHAVAAVRLAAALMGWRATMLADWSHREIAALTGIDRDVDYVDAEREEPGCLLAVTSHTSRVVSREPGLGTCDVRLMTLMARPARPLLDAVRSGRWSGRASQLSEDHVEWKFIDEIARATEEPGRSGVKAAASTQSVVQALPRGGDGPDGVDARAVILQRRSALAFDGRSPIPRATFVQMLERAMPGPCAPWDALWWTPRIHLALFVHRVEGVDPGLYLLPRDPSIVDRMKTTCGREFLWETADDRIPLLCLARGDCRPLARRLSCDQEIAADGFFSLGMLADFEASLREHGPSFYRHLFWEAGVVGQVLYLEAEAAGARATGIGCFYDDPVHEALGVTGHALQSLYHFTVGMPIEDTRLTTEPGYLWER